MALAVTPSLKLITIVELTGTFGAPFAGDTPVTEGAVSTAFTVVKEKLKSDAIVSGGSFRSVSVTSPAVTFTTHVVPFGSGELGVSVN